jgi:hypothetical protein
MNIELPLEKLDLKVFEIIKESERMPDGTDVTIRWIDMSEPIDLERLTELCLLRHRNIECLMYYIVISKGKNPFEDFSITAGLYLVFERLTPLNPDNTSPMDDEIFEDYMGALKYSNSRGIVHGNITRECLRIDSGGCPKIAYWPVHRKDIKPDDLESLNRLFRPMIDKSEITKERTEQGDSFHEHRILSENSENISDKCTQTEPFLANDQNRCCCLS